MQHRFYYICSVFEDVVRSDRSIDSDSPAASGKVIRLCRAVRGVGGDAWILSIGRGRQRGTLRWHHSTVRRAGKVPIAYAAYWDFPLLTHLVSAISLCGVLGSLVIRQETKRPTLIFYNHEPYFLLILMVGRILGWRCVLDLEDGIRRDEMGLRAWLNRCLIHVYNCLCSGGAMLASSSLRNQVSLYPQYICHGIAPSVEGKKSWSSIPLQVLFSGSLLYETGVGIFLETMVLLLRESPDIFHHLKFVVTGYGAMSGNIEYISKNEMNGLLTFHGKLGHVEYKNILSQSHVGLCLKLPDNSMGATTFPSKVVEMAAYGLLVVSTPVSDVPKIFDNDSAVLLEETTPFALAQTFRQIVANPVRFGERALKGQLRVQSMYSARKVGRELLSFWDGEGSVDGSTS